MTKKIISLLKQLISVQNSLRKFIINCFISTKQSMYRISFTKIQFLKENFTGSILVEVQAENKEKYRTKPKKIKSNIAKFYGDFIEFSNKTNKIVIKIFEISPRRIIFLKDKFSLRSQIFQKGQKKSHIVKNQNMKIYFDSQIVQNTNSSTQESISDFSDIKQKLYLSPRMSQMKDSRQLSSEKGIKKNISVSAQRRTLSRSFCDVRSLQTKRIVF